ncbi:DUF167 domain-containing protein [Patescibacteria group bacterium]
MILTVHLKPGARETKIIEWLDPDTLKASVKELPLNGRANQALIKLLSRELKKPQQSITIIRGLTARIKQVKVE